MTKPYHITPEQALKILAKTNVPIEQVELFSLAKYVDIIYLHEVINAVLDEVLGEPIRHERGEWLDDYWLAINEKDIKHYQDLGYTVRTLYAPRKEK